MTPLGYIKIALAALILGGTFWFGYRTGSVHGTAALEALQAAQAENTAKAVLAERASAAVESARVQAKLKEYENAPIDPLVPGIVRRVFLNACPAGGPVPSAAAAPGGTGEAGGVPAGDQGAQRLYELAQAAADAAARDAARLDLCRSVWPVK
jgi:hypothetical protein